MSRRTLLIPLLILALLSACSDSTKPDPTRDDIRGQVVDASGQPVADAVVVLQHEIDQPPGGKTDKIRTAIRFDLSEAGPVWMWLASYCDNDTVRLLVAGELPAGQHSVIWDGRDDEGRPLADGVYWVHLVTPEQTTRNDILLLHLGYGDLDAGMVPAPLAVTDAGGYFRLDQACLPFGHSFAGTDELGEPTGTATVTRRVRVWAFNADDGAAGGGAWVTVDADVGAAVTVTLDAKARD
jgi:hypothetical protein